MRLTIGRSHSRGTMCQASVWERTQLLYVCSPDNPSGRVMTQDEWRDLFALSDRYGFVIAADECYSEVYFDEARPPLGALAAAHALGRDGLSASRLLRQPRRSAPTRQVFAPATSPATRR
jgi:DNA-binding transcriptional MocR family regulator